MDLVGDFSGLRVVGLETCLPILALVDLGMGCLVPWTKDKIEFELEVLLYIPTRPRLSTLTIFVYIDIFPLTGFWECEKVGAMTKGQRAYREFLKTPFWKAMTAEKKRLVVVCELCGDTKRLQSHHKIYPARWEDTTLEMLEVVCRHCHLLRHSGMTEDEFYRNQNYNAVEAISSEVRRSERLSDGDWDWVVWLLEDFGHEGAALCRVESIFRNLWYSRLQLPDRLGEIIRLYKAAKAKYE
jgi:hypothetical protein